MDLFDLSAKITLDTREYEKGMKAASKASKDVEKAMKSLRSPLDSAKNAISAITHPIQTVKAGFEATKKKISEIAHPIETFKSKLNEASASLETKRNKLSVLSAAYEQSKKKVADLTAEFNRSVKETGTSSTATQELAQKLSKAEQEATSAKAEMEAYARSVSNAGGKSEEASKKVAKFGNLLKTSAVGAAKATGAAVAASAAAVGAIVKQAVDAYGEYEQLVGGAQKIFDEMDYSTIAADAANAWNTMNLSASQYLAMMNSVGATFSATMGDEKGYETAKRGMQAIADYASGTGRNVEELNQKFALITRSSSSYQSIADQFSGILPATSKDFLAQAQAAGYLSTKYKELTKVPVNEYQEAVALMLEKGVADLGLAGNTAAETAGTITGSLAGLKASWQNLLVAFGSGEGVKSAMGNLISNAKNVVKNVMPIARNALTGIATFVKDVGPIIVQELPALIQELLPELLSTAVALVASLIQALPGILAALWDTLKTLFSTFMDWLREASPELAAVFDGVIAAGKKVVDFFANFKANIAAVWNNIKSTAARKWEEIKTAITEAWDGIKNAIANAVEAVKTAVSSKFDAIKDKIASVVTSIKGKFDTLKQQLSNVKTKFTDVANAIKNMFNFKFSLPKFPTPKFSVVPAGWKLKDLFDGVIPSIDITWNKKAYDNPYMFTKPTLYGFGDGNGGEMVYGHDNLMRDIENAVGKTSDPRIDTIVSLLEDIAQNGLNANISRNQVYRAVNQENRIRTKSTNYNALGAMA